jgi:ATP-dependent NAD(P)H-hydrate dehydratase
MEKTSAAASENVNVDELDLSRAEDQIKALEAFRANAIPNLEADFRTNYKGKAGRKIGIVGGDRKYSGAPYFAAMAACKAGADLVHVFCHEEAARAIKSYSPDLIVHGCMKDERDLLETKEDMKEDLQNFCREEKMQEDFRIENILLENCREILSRMDAMVIGPGLGRDRVMWACAKKCFEVARHRNIPVVFDADALFMIDTSSAWSEDNEMEKYKWHNGYVVFTPNVREYTYGFDPNNPCGTTMSHVRSFLELERRDGIRHSGHRIYPSILAKGVDDIYVHLDGSQEGPIKFGNIPGSKKRCGGQGDILSGVLAVFLAWSAEQYRREFEQRDAEHATIEEVKDHFRRSSKLACFCASKLTREAARRAYEKQKRSLQSSDILLELPSALEDLFPSDVVVDFNDKDDGNMNNNNANNNNNNNSSRRTKVKRERNY